MEIEVQCPYCGHVQDENNENDVFLCEGCENNFDLEGNESEAK